MENFIIITKTIFPIFIIVLVFLAGVGFLLNHIFLNYLKERHVEKWKKLGSPSLFTNNSIQNNIKMLRFFKNKEYLELNDSILAKKAIFLWKYSLAYLCYFIILIILFFSTLIKI
jgi:hypothetical protein